MEDTLIQRRQELEERIKECLRFREAHTKASQMYATRNSRLALAALVFSALTGASALWSAIGTTYFAHQGTSVSVTLWGTAITGLITAFVTGAQKTNWASAEQAKAHHETAARYYQVAREGQRALADTSATKEILNQALVEVDQHIDGINTAEPFLPPRFSPEPEPESVQLDKLHKEGFVDIFETRASGSAANILGERFESKPRNVQILETWTGYGSQLDTWITQAVTDGAAVEILLLDPTSAHVKNRAQALSSTGVSTHDVKNHIEGDLKVLGQILGKLDQDSGYKGTLEIRVYNVTPVVNIYRFDEIRIIGMYLWAEDSITGPQLEIQASEAGMRTPLANEFDTHFKNIWDHTGENPTKPVTVKKVESATKTVKVTNSEVIVEI